MFLLKVIVIIVCFCLAGFFLSDLDGGSQGVFAAGVGFSFITVITVLSLVDQILELP